MDRNPPGLLERDGELAVLGRLLDGACAGTGALAVVEGPAGIGKTSVLRACAAAGSERGMTALWTRGDELVMESSFAPVRELLWATVAEHDLFHGAARLAAPVFEVGEAELIDYDRVAGVMHGLFWLIADLADRGPLVLLVDDAHWLDAASARFLVYLGRRLESLPALAVVGLRRGEGTDLAGLRMALAEVAATLLVPAPLSEEGAAALVRGVLGPRADEELCRSCHETTRGNPFYLRELAAAIKAEPVGPSLVTPDRVRALGAGAVARSVLTRLVRLGADSERLAEAMAVLAPGSALRHAAQLAKLEREPAQRAADTLRAADLFAPGSTLSFAHPIVREAVAAQLSPSRRAALHLEAARLLAGEGAPVDRVGAHLLSAEPFGDEWVVKALRRAAAAALARGAPEAAVSYLRRALAEPPAQDDRVQVLVELGRAEALLPVEQDFGALREALALADDPVQRAEIALELAWALTPVGRFCEVADLLEDTLASSGDLPAALVGRIEALLLGGGGPCLRASQRVRARTARFLDRAKRDEVEDPVMLAALAQSWGAAGLPAARMSDLAVRALRDGRLLAFPIAYIGAAVALTWADQFDAAARMQDAGIAEAQRRGSAALFMHISSFRAETALRCGELRVAEALAEPALRLGRELGTVHFGAMFFVPVLLERGRVEEAQELVSSLSLTDTELAAWQGVVVLAHRGRVRVTLGQLEAGASDLLDADRLMTAGGCDLSVLCDWVPVAAGALARLSRRDEATALATRELRAARAFGAERRLGMALSTCGLLDPSAEGLGLLYEAVELLERSQARLEHARALVNLGSGMRALGQREEARNPLADGLELADRCGAVALAEQARAELVAAGARPRRRALSGPESLTPAELRTAQLAADGLSNRQIAQAQFVAVKTVETQLSHAYAKLRITGRGELRDALAGDGRQNIGVPVTKD